MGASIVIALEGVSSAGHGTREARAINYLRDAISGVVMVVVVTHPLVSLLSDFGDVDKFITNNGD